MVNISNNFTTAQSLTLNSAAQSASLFKVGQVVTANIEQIQGKQVTLSIGSQTLVATSKLDLQESGLIQVRIKQLQPTIELAIIRAPKQNNSQQLQNVLQAALRQVIPNQTALPQAFQQISLLQGLPASLLGPVNQLLEQIVKSQIPLSGSALKQKMADSGLFLESKLKQADKPNLNHDIKSQLLSLRQQAEALNIRSPSPQIAQLLGSLNQAINRITLQQLQLYENPNITSLDLPSSHKKQDEQDYIEFRKHSESGSPRWEVLIDLHLPIGEMSAKLTLNQQNEFNCFLWCETETLERSISEHLTQLKKQFEHQNLQLQNLLIVKQKPTKTEKSTQVALIDIHI
ncbi:hypothetical protein [Thiomicrorhabdus arctica]|uniref:hypothetical protein n=1 Tax=Thiomicrorhabdus arctica TaxID=131540 RepID=UPI00036D1D85|nr:hypothetical protein [Thiomicrorhabdus arctica]